jgi:hypothetical protein
MTEPLEQLPESPETAAPPAPAPDTTPAPPAPPAPAPDTTPAPPAPDMRPRPLIERIGMAAIAVVIGAVFGVVAVAAFVGGEPFLGIMGAVGALMVLWVGGLTLIRG